MFKKLIIPQKIIVKFKKSLRFVISRCRKLFLLFLLSNPSRPTDSISISKAIFIKATNKNRYFQSMLKNKLPLTKIGEIKPTDTNPICNLITAELLFSLAWSFTIETEFMTISPKNIPNEI